MGLDAMLLTDVLDASAHLLQERSHFVALLLAFCGVLFSIRYYPSVILIIDINYIQGPYWVIAFWTTDCRYPFSVLSSYGVQQVMCALCVKVLITLYFASVLWWLSQCRYLTVYTGFLYTLTDTVLSCSKVDQCVQKQQRPVNVIEESMELMCSRKLSLCPVFWVTKVSSTYLF